MRIGIDARLYTQTGVGRYLRNLISELGRLDRENEYVVYLRNKEFETFIPPAKNWRKFLLDIPWHTVKEQIVLPYTLSKDGLDVAHFPYFNVPVFYPGKYLLTIHDLIVNHFDTGRASTLPPFLYKTKRMAYSLAMKRGIQRASAITVISETTRQEVLDHYRVDPTRLTVTYDALDEEFQQTVNKHQAEKRYPFHYILYIGNAYPHKNLERLIYSMKEIRQKGVKLVLAGDDEYFFPRLKKYASHLGLLEDIIFFGNANDQDLIDLYSFAKCLVFPSLMEGFGLPTFEALACSCLPVISDIPVFREIWDDDLPMFDPEVPNDMATVILTSLKLPVQIYRHKVQKAAKRIRNFSWKNTARQTLDLYEQIYRNITNYSFQSKV